MKVYKFNKKEGGVLLQNGSDTDRAVVLVNEFRSPRLLLS